MHRTLRDAIAFAEVTTPGAHGCRMRELITDREGAPTFAMRQFAVDPGGHTPYHSHPWEHEVYILSGKGEVRLKDGPVGIAAGDAVLIAPDEEHSFVNTGSEVLTFLCLIPVSRGCCR